MPYALIPDGYSLKKVTKLQKQAVNEKRRHDDVVALLSNENAPLVIAGVIATILIPTIAQQVATDTGLSLDIVTDSLKTAFYEGTLLGKATQFVQGLDFSEFGKLKVKEGIP